jgi:hypothetical protein
MAKQKGDATPDLQEPKPLPTLTDAEKIRVLMLQRQVLQLQPQYEKAVAELNRAYQALMAANPGHNFNEISLEFVPVEK